MKIGLKGVEDEAGRVLGRLSQARRNPGKKQEADQGPLSTEWTLVEVEGVRGGCAVLPSSVVHVLGLGSLWGTQGYPGGTTLLCYSSGRAFVSAVW